MSVDEVRQYFLARGLEDPVLILSESSATVELAARALGVEPKFIAKTLAFWVCDEPVLILARGDARIENKKFKDVFGTKAKMLGPEQVEEWTGHPVGGVCPFGLRRPIGVFLDIGMRDFDAVYPAAGAGNAALKVTPDGLQELTGARWIDVCRAEQQT
jgi:prolyl-tRNA editing enzyme YbaK/EbsC (Cys-tRNA(Pro) deacylase)